MWILWTNAGESRIWGLHNSCWLIRILSLPWRCCWVLASDLRCPSLRTAYFASNPLVAARLLRSQEFKSWRAKKRASKRELWFSCVPGQPFFFFFFLHRCLCLAGKKVLKQQNLSVHILQMKHMVRHDAMLKMELISEISFRYSLAMVWLSLFSQQIQNSAAFRIWHIINVHFPLKPPKIWL